MKYTLSMYNYPDAKTSFEFMSDFHTKIKLDFIEKVIFDWLF